MLFKIALVLLVIAMLVSLSGGLNALFQSNEKTLNWLTIRVSIAVAIVIVITLGLLTGELTIGAPWLSTGQR